MKNNRLYRLLYGIVFLPGLACGQVVITPGAILAVEGNPQIVVKTDKNIVNQNDFDFSATQLYVELFSGAQGITGDLVAHQLSLTGGTQKTVTGNLTVTHGIDFVLGLLGPGNAGKILYTGPAENLTGASENSHVNGMFYTQANGSLFFPVGAEGIGYAPAWLEHGNGAETGVEVIADAPDFVFDPVNSELQAIEPSRYWQITRADLAALNSKITLSLNGVAGFGSELSPVVVQADNTEGQAENLLSTTDGNVITSRKNITKPFVAVGASKEIDLVVHDIITPYAQDEMNDHLHIENIDKFDVNKVTLLDRWGVPVREWVNFRNYNDPISPNLDGYDFTKLSPGNYICVVEYGDLEAGLQKKSQMITVLKAN